MRGMRYLGEPRRTGHEAFNERQDDLAQLAAYRLGAPAIAGTPPEQADTAVPFVPEVTEPDLMVGGEQLVGHVSEVA